MTNPIRNNQTKPNQTQTTPSGARGISRSRVQSTPTAEAPEQSWSERRAWEFDFVRRELPNEHPGLAVSALLSLRLLGVKPTRQAILDRLEATGRSARQLKERR